MGTLVSMRTASEPMWKPTFSAPNIWCRMPERMCSPVCCCILSNRQSQSMQPVTAAPGTAVSGRASTRVPDDAVLLVDIGHMQHRAVRQGQGAPVGGLTAALRVEHRAVQRNAPAAGLFVRLCGKDDAFAFGAESILLKYFSVRCMARENFLFRVQFDDLKWPPQALAIFSGKSLCRIGTTAVVPILFTQGAVKANNKRDFTASAGFGPSGENAFGAARVCAAVESPGLRRSASADGGAPRHSAGRGLLNIAERKARKRDTHPV